MKLVSLFIKSPLLLVAGIILALPGYGQASVAGKAAADTVANCGCPAINYVRPKPRFFNALNNFTSEKTITAL
jgi:hypothetical protein